MVTAGPAPCKPQDEVHTAGSGLLVRLVSNVVSFAWVRGRPPRHIRYGQRRSRTVADPGERWSALLEACWCRTALCGTPSAANGVARRSSVGRAPICARTRSLRAYFRRPRADRDTESGAVRADS